MKPLKPLSPLIPLLFLIFLASSASGWQGKPGDVWKEPITGMEFIWLDGDCFEMGSPVSEKGHQDNEQLHRICVDGFWIGRYDVTNGEFRRMTEDHNSGSWRSGSGGYPVASLDGKKQPVVEVSWNDAKAYAGWLTRQNGGKMEFRLPTEAEWEYACRAGSRTSRFWGDLPDMACQYANVADASVKPMEPGWNVHNCDDGYAASSPVGSFQANAFGLYDMLGNVWQWCEDLYVPDASAGNQNNNPINRNGGPGRVYRGGSWSGEPDYVRCAYRYFLDPAARGRRLGFRLVGTP